MIDLHSHILPGIDDGAASQEAALEMARIYVAQGVQAVACTPHILPGVYHNSGQDIRAAVAQLQARLDEAGIALSLFTGADNHVVSDFVSGVREGRLLTLGDTRYVLVEPPHNVAPPRFDDLVFNILLGGYVPIITHPERLKWIETDYDLMTRLCERGVWMQVTASSLTGRFGRRPRYWAERMICEGRVQILATDAHDPKGRPPDLEEGWTAACRLVGTQEAAQMVSGRPSFILCDGHPGESAPIQVEQPPPRGEGERHVEGPGRSRDAGLVGRLRRLLG
ncbi:MAG: CpsB/CapC family capsule biosynthesis tyrosine phosphatase [Pseudomonadota bacterium]